MKGVFECYFCQGYPPLTRGDNMEGLHFFDEHHSVLHNIFDKERRDP